MKNKYKVIDNFLEQSYFNELVDLYEANDFGWFVCREITNKGEKLGNLYYQTHTLFIDHKIHSPHFGKFDPLLKKLGVKALLRLRTNLFPGKDKVSEHGWHIDYQFKNKTAVFYINTNDGYTKFKDGTKIESVANRMLIFDSSYWHKSTDCSNQWARLSLNINYF